MPFNALMDRHGVDHIDYLNVDVEGCDWEIIRSIDFDRFRPSCCVEVTALNVENTALDSC